MTVRSFARRKGDARRESVLAAPEPGVQNVAEPVAEQIGAEHDQHDSEGGEDAGRPGGCDIVAGVGHYFAPGRDQRRNAEAEEAQGRFGEISSRTRGWRSR